MSASDEDIDFVTDLFSEIGPISTRKMMGGLSIYASGQIFSIIGPEGKLYLKATDALAQALADEGSEIFEYTRKDGKSVQMGYWTLPDAALDDPELACTWARKALAAL